MSMHEFFDSLTDEELLRRVSAGGLTEEALAVALSELTSRGMPDPRQDAVDMSVEPAGPAEFVVLEKGLSRDEATSIACGLQSAGIPYAYGGIRRAQVSYGRAIVASVDLIVPMEQLTSAREAVAAYRRGDLSIDESFDPSGET